MTNRYTELPKLQSVEKSENRALGEWWQEQTRQLEYLEESLRALASNPYFIQKYANGGFGRLYRNAGTAVTQAATCVSVSHALNGPPSQVWVTPNTCVGPFWVTALTTVSFAIQWQASVSANFYWQAEL